MKFVFYMLVAIGFTFPNIAMAELIILAAPRTGDPYYERVKDGIFNFHITYAQKLLDNGDQVLILTDKKSHERYKEALGQRHVVLFAVSDIWMRDFAPANVVSPIMFRYTAAGQGGGRQGQRDADAVQEELARFAQRAGVIYPETDLLNDGGNFVDDYSGNAVVSRKFLRDNHLTEPQGRKRLRQLTGIRHVAFIESDEQGGLEHADGVVSFVDTNTLVINSYPDKPRYARQLKADLKRGLPGVKIHEIVTPYDGSNIHDERFGSACGLYTNALVTPERIYLPQFGIPEDKIALAQVKAVTSRDVVAVDAREVCFMGGGVRCLSWQLRGRTAARFLSD